MAVAKVPDVLGHAQRIVAGFVELVSEALGWLTKGSRFEGKGNRQQQGEL
jgi:hypothetical protein